MTRFVTLLLLALCAAFALGAAFAQEAAGQAPERVAAAEQSEEAPDPEPDEAESGEEEEDDGSYSEEDDDDFVPTQEVSSDQSVNFPVDI